MIEAFYKNGVWYYRTVPDRPFDYIKPPPFERWAAVFLACLFTYLLISHVL